MSQRDHDLVLVIDFGAQYAQLIARRVREANVYSEIMPHTASTSEILARRPKAIILSGGPSSVYEPGAPQLDAALVDSGTPAMGICYGFMAMAQVLGGSVDDLNIVLCAFLYWLDFGFCIRHSDVLPYPLQVNCVASGRWGKRVLDQHEIGSRSPITDACGDEDVCAGCCGAECLR